MYVLVEVFKNVWTLVRCLYSVKKQKNKNCWTCHESDVFGFVRQMNYESNNSKCRFTKLLIDYPELNGHRGSEMQTTSRRTISTMVLLQSTYTRSAEYVPLIKVHVYGPDYIIFLSMNRQMDGRLDVTKQTRKEQNK